ncbi:MAG: ATP-binding cassette domain-containing protein, partial [Polaromonas sp.]
MTKPLLQLTGVAKRFTLHNQNGMELSVLANANLNVSAGECVVLDGPSGMGKSTLLKMIYANYRASAGSISVMLPGRAPLEVTEATPREL